MSKSRLFGACLLACAGLVSMSAEAANANYTFNANSAAVNGGYSTHSVVGDIFHVANIADVDYFTGAINAAAGTSFSDTVSFYLDGNLGSDVAALGGVVNKVRGIDNLAFGGLFKGDALSGPGVAVAGVGIGLNDNSFHVDSLAAGSYYVVITGQTRTGGGYFGFDLLTSAPVITGSVPEPETWAMMLAGLGIAGSVVRRKKADALQAIAA